MAIPVVRALGPLRSAKAAAAHPERYESDNTSQLMKAIGSVDPRDALHRIQCPVLVVYGSRDAVMVAGGQMLEDGLPHAQVRILAGVGHEPFIETPDDAFAAVARR